MSFDWYPWYVQDFRRDTLHLSLAQEGAYRRLIDEYMVSGSALPDNDAALARICGCGVDEWMIVSPVVRDFFHVEQGHLTHKRCESELHAQRMLGASRSAHAKSAADARWKTNRENKEVMRRASGEHAPRMPKNATLHNNTSFLLGAETKKENLDGSLATALPTGALRSPSREQNIPVSDQLKSLVASKGWAT